MYKFTSHPIPRSYDGTFPCFRNGNKRIYYCDLNTRSFYLENCTPYMFKIGHDFITTTFEWSKLLPEIAVYLQTTFPKNSEELFNFSFDWSKAKLFTKSKVTINSVEIFPGIYLNINHTAVHSQWVIRDLLIFYKINLEKCTFFIRKLPGVEPEEITTLVIAWVKENFRIFLEKKYNEKQIDSIIKSIDVINKIQSHISPTFNNFYLFDNPLALSNYKINFFKQCQMFVKWDSNKIFIARKYLDLYTEFFTEQNRWLKSH